MQHNNDIKVDSLKNFRKEISWWINEMGINHKHKYQYEI